MAKANISVDALQKIQSVNSDQSSDNIEVVLKKAVENDNTYIEVKSVSGNSKPVTAKVAHGDSKTDIDVSAIDAGVVVISLKCDEKYIDNTKFMKK